MGALAEGFVAYAQPLLDQTDGTMEQMQKAMTISQLCWNLALQPEEKRDQMLSEMRPSLDMDEAEFHDFRRSIIDPMVRRHQELYPRMHLGRWFAASPDGPSPREPSAPAAREAHPKTDPYAPCPCQSGKKYKFCCRQKGR